MTGREWVQVKHVAEVCHVVPRTVRRWCEDGTIPSDKHTRTLGGHLRISLAWVVNRSREVAEEAE